MSTEPGTESRTQKSYDDGTCARWAQMDLNHRPHPYQMCETIRTVWIKNDQISTVGAGVTIRLCTPLFQESFR
jgi:hypothetical protein